MATDLDEFHAFVHDVRAYLRDIVTLSDLTLKREKDTVTGPVREALERIGLAGRNCDELVKAAAAYEEAEGRPEDTISGDLLLRGAIIEIRGRVESASGTLAVIGSLGRDEVPRSLHYVVKELIENALKFRKAHLQPNICVRCMEEDPQWLVLHVEDNGQGIAEPYREEVFLPYRRLHPRHSIPGFGLGLPRCRKILTQLGGLIEVLASPNEAGGLTMQVKAPRLLQLAPRYGA